MNGKKCDLCDIKNAKRIGRAHWICPICGRDISLEYLFYAQAAHPEWSDFVKTNEKHKDA